MEEKRWNQELGNFKEGKFNAKVEEQWEYLRGVLRPAKDGRKKMELGIG